MGKTDNILPAGEFEPGQGFADRKFDQALQHLVDKGAIPGYLVIRRNSTIDGEGIDRLILLPGGLAAAAQIKSKHKHRFKKEILRHLEIHPLVLCIFGVEKRESVRRLSIRIMRKLNKMIRQTKEIGFRIEPNPQTAIPTKILPQKGD